MMKPEPFAPTARLRFVTGVVGLLLALCGSLVSCAEPTGSSSAKNAKLTIGLTYVPNIQFSPFYVAEAKGYYKEAGLSVKLRHHTAGEDLFGGLESGREDAVLAGGDEMLQGRSKSVPVVSVAQLYHRYPVSLMVPEKSGIRQAKDLRGKSVGIPGPYGEAYFALLALLSEGGLTEKDVDVKNIGFTQQAALVGDKVDGVMGYVNNEGVGFDKADFPVRSISPYAGEKELPLVSIGIGARQSVADKRAGDLRKFLDATLRGVRFVLSHPEETVELSRTYVPGLTGEKQKRDALAVLNATRPLLKNSAGALGRHDAERWQSMAVFMAEQKLLSKKVDVTSAFSNKYLP
ncbi:ABC transporter substrate-binding protein [Streptomyces sp. NPDC004647]|uniref:ABC transporter substrate-binding protein n=1 Tax=Streptomyces sp. NPDC004647 TaxID=3154671 RepID=UPI0033AAB073